MKELPLIPGILFLLVTSIIITRVCRGIAYNIGEVIIRLFKYLRDMINN